MPNFSGLDGKKLELIRKPLGGSLFVGEITAAIISALTDTSGALVALPSTGGGYADGGCFTDEGLRFERAIEQDEVTSFGFNTPTRTDITTDTESLQVDFQETNKRTISLFTGADYATLQPATSSGEIKIVKPNVASPRRYRALALSVDGPPEAEIYIARFYPRLAVTDYAGQAYAKGSELRWGASFRAEKDSTVGSPLVYFFGGPGWKAICTQMGFTVPA